MTTAGTVASQVPAPKTTVGAARDAGAKGDAPTGGDDGEFADVLTKLQGEDAPRTGALPDGQQQANEPRGVDDGTDIASIESVLDSLSGGDRQPDATPGSAPAATPINDIIAAALAPAQPAPTRQPEQGAPTQTQTQTQTQGSLAASKPAPVDETVGSASPNQPDAMVDSAPAEFTAAETMAAATDPALARAGARAASPDKGKPERKPSADPLDDSRSSATVATAIQPHENKVEESPPPTANVVRQEVHFAPVASAQAPAGTAGGEPGQGAVAPEALDGDPTSTSSIDAMLPSAEDMQSSGARPAQQIAERILSEAGTAPEFADPAGITTGQPGMKPALKVLHIQLQPADMGTVTVRMELKDAELSLQVEADRAETVNMIRNDQDTLSSLLRSAGYNVDSGSVRVVEVDRTAASQQSGQNGAQSSFQSPSQSQSGASERQGHQQRGGADTNGAEAAPQMTRNDAYDTNANRAGRGLYL